MDIYLEQSWVDERLTFNSSTEPINVNARIVDRMWIPDTYFPTEKSAAFHNVPLPSRMMEVHPDGKVTYSMRLVEEYYHC